MPHSLSGSSVSHYDVLEELGRGGMGVVYKARDTKLNRAVALRFLPPQFTLDEETTARFVREAQAVAIGYDQSIEPLRKWAEEVGGFD